MLCDVRPFSMFCRTAAVDSCLRISDGFLISPHGDHVQINTHTELYNRPVLHQFAHLVEAFVDLLWPRKLNKRCETDSHL